MFQALLCPSSGACDYVVVYHIGRVVLGLLYEVVTKIFRTDPVKIVELTIRPIGRRHPRSSSLPHVATGPTVSSIFETLPGTPFLSDCQALSAIRPFISSMVSNRRPFSFYFIFGNRKKSRGAKSGEYGGWGMTAILFFAINWWVKTEVRDGALSW